MYNLFQTVDAFLFTLTLLLCLPPLFGEMGERRAGKTALSLPLPFLFFTRTQVAPSYVPPSIRPSLMESTRHSTPSFTYTHPADILRNVIRSTHIHTHTPTWLHQPSFISLGFPCKLFSIQSLRIVKIQFLNDSITRAMLCFTVYDVRPSDVSLSDIELRLSPGSPSVSFSPLMDLPLIWSVSSDEERSE